ncbi:hypothetical protein H1P_1010013 [Hyella patelloides LEGE 07179]|uniref:Uncharacterized protein n=1 Tax=Hyella patelloides LEGE 07179 TaxID=945734 RepID=A0A563VJ80_9CYAN|nr:hypothetical protein H1P_1010013 [Hyella patelloides LEGE 07179]
MLLLLLILHLVQEVRSQKSEVRSVFKSETETHDLKNTSYRTGSLKLRASTDNQSVYKDDIFYFIDDFYH